MNTIKIIASIFLLSFVLGCSEDANKPIEGNSNPPGQITVTDIENIPGGATIKYTLPTDPDLLYVLARYTEKGVKREFKASLYTNTLTVTGLSREEEYEIELATVNRSNIFSESMFVTINPLTPPVMGVYQSLQAEATFGGISFTYENPSMAPVAIGVLVMDEEGEFYEHETFYSSQPDPVFSVRGFDSGEREFRIYVRDTWENSSDTASFKVTPIGEIPLDKSKFREVRLKGDADPTEWGGRMEYIWDDRIVGDNEGSWGLHTGNAAINAPKYITFDLGVNATLSRFKLWIIMDDKHMFNDMSPRNYEIWGRSETIESVSQDDGEFFPHWFKMGEVENFKPSGLALGSLTDDDRAVARAGDEYVFNYQEFTTRYIRILCKRNWNGNTNMCFGEVAFWATKIEEL